MAAGLDGAFDHAETDDGEGGCGAGDDDVEVCDAFRKILQADCRAVIAGGKRLAAIDGTVGDRDGGGILGAEVRGAEFNHFARAHVKDVFFFKRAEKSHRETDGGGCQTHGTRADGGFGADVLGGGKSGFKEMVEHHAQRFLFTGGLDGLFKLPHDLCFAQNHGVNAADDAEKMTRAFPVGMAVKVRCELRQGHRLRVGKKFREALGGAFGVLRRTIKFGAVAGRKNHGFGDAAGVR